MGNFELQKFYFTTPLYYVQDVEWDIAKWAVVRSIYKHIYVTQWSQICIFTASVGIFFWWNVILTYFNTLENPRIWENHWISDGRVLFWEKVHSLLDKSSLFLPRKPLLSAKIWTPKFYFTTPLYYVQEMLRKSCCVCTAGSIYKHIYVTQWSQIWIFTASVGIFFDEMSF